MIVLGIETSCDETAVCFLKIDEKKYRVLSHLIFSQIKFHEKYGGVYPLLAKRLHEKNLPFLYEKAKKESKTQKPDLICAVKGPGLEPCLWQGFNFAKTLAKEIPFLLVNHLEAHVLINLLEKKVIFQKEKLKEILPSLCLVVSGGHTILFLMKKIGDYQKLGETRDDAVGEAFDKIGRLLGFSYPAGPKISSFLEKFKKVKIDLKIHLPRPMINQKNYDFSFSGLKTAVFYDFQSRRKKERESKKYKLAILRELEEAISEVLILKSKRALDQFRPKSFLLGGGVMADPIIKKKFLNLSKENKIKILIPQKENCGDNALSIAFLGYLYFLKGHLKKDKINANLTV